MRPDLAAAQRVVVALILVGVLAGELRDRPSKPLSMRTQPRKISLAASYPTTRRADTSLASGDDHGVPLKLGHSGPMLIWATINSAAVVGLVLAALGVGLRQLTGSPAWDGGASIAIGALLVAVAIKLGRTMHMGPDNLIVAARVALNDELGADQTEDLADEVDRRLSEKLPLQPHVFIDPTQIRPTPPPASPFSPR